MISRPLRNLNVAIGFMAVQWAVLSAEVVLRLDVPTNTVVTITVSAASQVTVATNIVQAVPDARGSLPRPIPMPQVPFVTLRALPDSTNQSYNAAPMPPAFPDRKIIWIKDWAGDPKNYTFKSLVPLEEVAEKASKGLRRSE